MPLRARRHNDGYELSYPGNDPLQVPSRQWLALCAVIRHHHAASVEQIGAALKGCQNGEPLLHIWRVTAPTGELPYNGIIPYRDEYHLEVIDGECRSSELVLPAAAWHETCTQLRRARVS